MGSDLRSIESRTPGVFRLWFVWMIACACTNERGFTQDASSIETEEQFKQEGGQSEIDNWRPKLESLRRDVAWAMRIGNDRGAIGTQEDIVKLLRSIARLDGQDQSRMDLASALVKLGVMIGGDEHSDAPLPHLREAESIYRDLGDDGNLKVTAGLARCLSNLGVCLSDCGRLHEAIEHYEEAYLHIRKVHAGDRNAETIDQEINVLLEMGRLSEHLDDYEKATHYVHRAWEIAKEFDAGHGLTDGGPRTAAILHKLSMKKLECRQYGDAEVGLRRAREIYERLLSKNQLPGGKLPLLYCMRDLGVFYSAQGMFARARKALDETLIATRTHFGSNDDEGLRFQAEVLGHLVDLLRNQGDDSLADYYQHSQKRVYDRLGEDIVEPDIPEVVSNNLLIVGMDQLHRGDIRRARQLIEESLRIRRMLYPRQRFPDGHQTIADCLMAIGDCERLEGDVETAEQLYLSGVEIYRRILNGRNDDREGPRLASILRRAGVRFSLIDRFADAERLLRESLAIYKYVDGENVAVEEGLFEVQYALGGLLANRERYDEARTLFGDMLEQARDSVKHSATNTAMMELSSILWYLGLTNVSVGDVDVALGHFNESFDIQKKITESFALAGSEAEAMAFAEYLGKVRDGILTASVKGDLKASPPKEEVYESVWDSQAIVLRGLIDRYRAFGRSPVRDEIEALRRELLLTRQRLASLIVGLYIGRQTTAGIRDKAHQLQARKESIERQLQAAGGTVERPGRQFRYQELSERLDGPNAFIHIVRYVDLSGRDKEGPDSHERYAAFVMQDNRVNRVELGESNKIDQLIEEWIGHVRDRSNRWSTKLEELGRALRSSVWTPIETILSEETRTVLVCPDGAFCSMAWGAIPGNGPGTYLIEDYAFSTVPYGGYLLETTFAEPTQKSKESEAFLGVGNIDFGSTVPVGSHPGDEDANDARKRRPLWRPLPATAEELDAIRRLRPEIEFTHLGSSAAKPEAVVEKLRRAKSAHISTHGWYGEHGLTGRSTIIVPKFDATSVQNSEQTVQRNPLAVCGLVLAGANYDTAGSESGILTGEAIAAENLSGLDQVVLSACETHLGLVRRSEGVFGLQRAFHMAGARTVIGSLWRVDDEATRVLMVEFYKNLWDRGMGRLDALRRAQLSVLRHYDSWNGRLLERNEVGDKRQLRNPPYYWAGWALSGDPGTNSLVGSDSFDAPEEDSATQSWRRSRDEMMLAMLVVGACVFVIVLATAMRKRYLHRRNTDA